VNVAERNLRRLDQFQQRHAPLAVVFGVRKKFGDDYAETLVAALAYAGFVALFPLLLILVTVLGLVLSSHPGLRHSVLHSTFAEFPVVGTNLAANITGLHRSSVLGLVVGLVGVAWGSTKLAQAGMVAMAQIWNLPGSQRPSFPRRVMRSLAFIAVLGVGLATSSALSSFGTFGRHDVLLGMAGEVLAVGVNMGQYLLAFRTLTPSAVVTTDLVPGAVVGGIAWTLVLAFGGYLIGHDLRHATAIYGLFGAVLGLLAWVYLGAQISIYCAELNTVIGGRLWPRALVRPPLTDADRRAMALLATQTRAGHKSG
jgi:YihY family inner membrane protein